MEKESQQLVSVGIPTYRRPEGLRQTLECITRQTYKNLEIIVSDNGSPEVEIREIFREYEAKDKRIKFYFQENNMGIKFNFDFVLKKSTGKYFMWAADDDFWEPEFIEKMVELLSANSGANASFCAFRINNKQEVFNYLNDHSALSSLNIDRRLNGYLSYPDESLGKASIFYALFKRDTLNYLYHKINDKLTMENYAPDNLLILNLLAEGQVMFSAQPLYGLTVNNIKHYECNYSSEKNSISITLFVVMRKYFKVLTMLIRYMGSVLNVIFKSKASLMCKSYWMLIYPLYILKLIFKTTRRLMLDRRFWTKYFGFFKKAPNCYERKF